MSIKNRTNSKNLRFPVNLLRQRLRLQEEKAGNMRRRRFCLRE